jgi:hypothetical protein
MKKLDYLLLICIQIVVLSATLVCQKSPGYMDAEYYLAGGVQLVEGKGFYEPFLWNYLDDPQNVIHPANTYWMPLAGILSAMGMSALTWKSFFAARIPFMLLALLIPLLTAHTAWLFSKRRSAAWLAGVLAIFSGFYVLYFSITDTFILYMLLGGISFLLVSKIFSRSDARFRWEYPVLGVLAGLLHASRSDGLLWLIFFLIISLWEGFKNRKKPAIDMFQFICILVGYLLVMGAWYARNIVIFRSVFPTGTSKVLWLTEYDELFSYPSSGISFSNWWSVGFGSHFAIYLQAFLANLGTAIGVEGLVFLTPLTILGLIRTWKNRAIRSFGFMWIGIFIFLTMVFPFAGMRGGFLHSSAAFQIPFMALVPIGMQSIIEFGIRKRKWKEDRSIRMFYPAILLFALLFTAFVYWMKVFGTDALQNGWEEHAVSFNRIEQRLHELGAEPNDLVMVTDPPGYYVQTGRSGIVTPYGGESDLLAAAYTYHADYLILTQNHVKGLDGLYNNANSSTNLELLDTSIPDVQIYKILQK